MYKCVSTQNFELSGGKDQLSQLTSSNFQCLKSTILGTNKICKDRWFLSENKGLNIGNVGDYESLATGDNLKELIGQSLIDLMTREGGGEMEESLYFEIHGIAKEFDSHFFDQLQKSYSFVDYIDKNGIPLIHYSITRGNEDIFRFLLKNGAKVNIRNRKDKNSSLHVACMTNKPSFWIYNLIINGAKVRTLNKRRQTPLHVLLCNPQIPCIKEHLHCVDILLSCLDPENIPHTSMEESLQTVDYTEISDNVNLMDTHTIKNHEVIPLFDTSSSITNKDYLQKLFFQNERKIICGCEGYCNSKTYDIKAQLPLSSSNKSLIVKILKIPDTEEKLTPLLCLKFALFRRSFDFAFYVSRRLLSIGACPNDQDKQGRTLLSYSVTYLDDTFRLTRLLVNYGAQVFVTNILFIPKERPFSEQQIKSQHAPQTMTPHSLNHDNFTDNNRRNKKMRNATPHKYLIRKGHHLLGTNDKLFNATSYPTNFKVKDGCKNQLVFGEYNVWKESNMANQNIRNSHSKSQKGGDIKRLSSVITSIPKCRPIDSHKRMSLLSKNHLFYKYHKKLLIHSKSQSPPHCNYKFIKANHLPRKCFEQKFKCEHRYKSKIKPRLDAIEPEWGHDNQFLFYREICKICKTYVRDLKNDSLENSRNSHLLKNQNNYCNIYCERDSILPLTPERKLRYFTRNIRNIPDINCDDNPYYCNDTVNYIGSTDSLSTDLITHLIRYNRKLDTTLSFMPPISSRTDNPITFLQTPTAVNSRRVKSQGNSYYNSIRVDEDQNCFNWFLKVVISRRKLENYRETLNILSRVMGREPLRMRSAVIRSMFIQLQCFRILGPLFLRIKQMISPYWNQPRSLKYLASLRVSDIMSKSDPGHRHSIYMSQNIGLPDPLLRYLLIMENEGREESNYFSNHNSLEILYNLRDTNNDA
ncbi:unnamed protein product [Gordionus sp. m RMFG-2023]